MEIEKDQNPSHGREHARVNENNKVAKPSFCEIVAGSSQWFSKARKIKLTSMEWGDEMEKLGPSDDMAVSCSKEELKRLREP